MLVDVDKIDEAQYIVLMFLANSERLQYYLPYPVKVDAIVDSLGKVVGVGEVTVALDGLMDSYLIELRSTEGKFLHERRPGAVARLTFLGLAVLINYANSFLERIASKYGELPENLTATLIPYLDLAKVPAADRYVSTSDNLPEFNRLAESLEVLRSEINKDQNANELPIRQKRAVIAEIDGTLAQIKGGYVKLSDLTSRIRPLVRKLAEWCKDITIIAIAAQQAYSAIEAILKGLH